MRATCAVAVVRDGRHVACGLDCERVFGGLAEDGEGGPGFGWECRVHGCVGAQLREEMGEMSEQRFSEQSYSRLAWELAQKSWLEVTDGGGVKASVAVSTGTVFGTGSTSNEAIRDLAHQLDRYAESSRS